MRPRRLGTFALQSDALPIELSCLQDTRRRKRNKSYPEAPPPETRDERVVESFDPQLYGLALDLGRSSLQALRREKAHTLKPTRIPNDGKPGMKVEGFREFRSAAVKASSTPPAKGLGCRA